MIPFLVVFLLQFYTSVYRFYCYSTIPLRRTIYKPGFLLVALISHFLWSIFHLVSLITRFFIRNQFISNPVLGNLKFKKLLELQGNSKETLGK